MKKKKEEVAEGENTSAVGCTRGFAGGFWPNTVRRYETRVALFGKRSTQGHPTAIFGKISFRKTI